MSVGSGDENALGRDAGGFERESFRLIAYMTGNHAAVHHCDGDVHLASLQNKTAGLEIARVHFSESTFQKSSVDQKGLEGGRDILNVGTCFELGFSGRGVLCRKIEPEGKEAAKHSSEKSVAPEERNFGVVCYHGRESCFPQVTVSLVKSRSKSMLEGFFMEYQPSLSGPSIS